VHIFPKNYLQEMWLGIAYALLRHLMLTGDVFMSQKHFVLCGLALWLAAGLLYLNGKVNSYFIERAPKCEFRKGYFPKNQPGGWSGFVQVPPGDWYDAKMSTVPQFGKIRTFFAVVSNEEHGRDVWGEHHKQYPATGIIEVRLGTGRPQTVVFTQPNQVQSFVLDGMGELYVKVHGDDCLVVAMKMEHAK
jgi:hypothetical protein